MPTPIATPLHKMHAATSRLHDGRRRHIKMTLHCAEISTAWSPVDLKATPPHCAAAEFPRDRNCSSRPGASHHLFHPFSDLAKTPTSSRLYTCCKREFTRFRNHNHTIT